MYGNSTLGIGLSMYLRDQFSAPAARISSSATQLEGRMASLKSQLMMERNVGAGMAFGGAMALRGLHRVVEEGAEFSFAMASVKAVAELTDNQMLHLSKEVKRLGQDTLFMSKDVASAAKYMGMAGFTYKELMGTLNAAVQVAGATHSELGGKGGTADIMTNIMRAFMIDPARSGNAMRVADIMTTATIKAQLDMNDLAEAIKYTSSTAMDLGVSLEDTVAMIMTLSNAGIRGTMAGTAIENELRYMSRSLTSFGTPKQIQSLKQLGLTFNDLQDSSGNLLPITQIFGKMGASIKQNFGGEQKSLVQNLLQNVFGVRGKRAASLLLRDYDTFMNFTETLKSGSMGSSVSVMNQMMDNIWGTLERIKGAAENLRINFTEAIAPIVKVVGRVVEGILEITNAIFGVPILGTILAGGLAGFITWVTVLGTAKLLVSGITLLMGSFGTTSASSLMRNLTGWKSSTLAAKEYYATIQAINLASSLQASGMMGFRPDLYKGKGGYFVRGASGGYRTFRNTGKFADYAGHTFGGGGANAATILTGGVLGASVGKTVASGLVKGGLGRVLGFLGGPWGMAASIALPAIIGVLTRAIQGNTKSTEENTNVLGDKNMSVNARYQRSYEHQVRFLSDYNNELTNANRLAQLVSLGKLNGTVSPEKGINGDIVINIGDQNVFRQSFNSILRDQFQVAGVPLTR